MHLLAVITDAQQVHRILRHPVRPTMTHPSQSIIHLERDFLCPDRREFPSQPVSDRRIRILEL